MNLQRVSIKCIVLVVTIGLCLGGGIAAAGNLAWDMVNTTDQNLISYGTDAPDFGFPGAGFQKYQWTVSPTIPYTLVDDSGGVYPADTLGIIDTQTDFDVFFGACNTYDPAVNTEPVHATWVFDISGGQDYLQLNVDLAAMGDFEAPDPQADPPIIGDFFALSYQVDGGSAHTYLTAIADEDGTMSYTLANGTVVTLDDPLVANGQELNNVLRTFTTNIPSGSQLTVTLTSLTDGGYEGFVVRNILVTDGNQAPPMGGEPIPAITGAGIAAMILLLAAAGVFVFRRWQ